MPQVIRYIIHNFGISITLLTIFSFVTVFHGFLVRSVIKENTEAVDRFSRIAAEQTEVNKHLADVASGSVDRFSRITAEQTEVNKHLADVASGSVDAINRETAQSRATWELAVQNKKLLLQVLGLLFIPIEKRIEQPHPKIEATPIPVFPGSSQ